MGINPTPYKCQNCPARFTEAPLLTEHRNLCLTFSNNSTSTVGDLRLQTELQEDQIRLIDLQPSSDPHAPLKGKLLTERSSHKPPYTALSYFWGSDGDSDCITINGKTIEITSNLSQALRHLRAQGKLLLWADRLCLDQGNELEMATQVKRMFAIYQMAKEVVIWLGLASPACANVMKKLSEQRNLPTLGRDMTITELRHLTDRPYWSRLWIIQEIAAATRLQIYCGMCILEWDRFQTFFTQVNERMLPLPAGFAKVMTIVSMRNDFKQRRPPMLEALLQTTHSRATKPRDKVYGLLGLASDSNHFVVEPNYLQEFSSSTMCMEMTERNILQLSSLDVIFLGRTLHSHSSLPSWCPDFIHLSDNVITKTLVKYISAMDQKTRLGRKDVRWSATGKERMSSENWITIDDNVITVTGVYVDAINSLGSISHELSVQSQTQTQPQTRSLRSDRKPSTLTANRFTDAKTKEYLGTMLLLYHPEYQKHKEAAQQLIPWFLDLYHKYYDSGNFNSKASSIRSWLGHHVPSARGDWERLMRHDSNDNSDAVSVSSNKTATWLSIQHQYPRTPMPTDRRPRTPADHTSSPSPSPKPIPSPKSHFRHEDFDMVVDSMYSIISEGLRLMITYESDVGWAHPDAELDDQIWLIDGCSMPVILRRIVDSPDSEKLYSVVGHCYMKSRIMSGNLWQHEKKKKRLQTVRLG